MFKPLNTRINQAQRPFFEALEPRWLMSADLPGLAIPIDGTQVVVKPAEHAPSFPGAARYEIAFIDGGLPDAQALAADMAEDTPERHLEVVLIDPTADGFEQVSAELAKRRGLDAIHLIGHGTDGTLSLGTSLLDAAEASRRAATLVRWHNALKPDADILLYGCRTAYGIDGYRLLQTLADLTGADVAGSVDATGARDLGGNWVLERQTGRVDAALALSLRMQQSYSAILAVPVAVNDSYSVNEDSTLTVAPSTTGLVNWYGLDDGGVSQAVVDSGFLANNGTLGSTAGVDTTDPAWTTGYVGGAALSFDGAGDYVVTTSTELSTASDFTLSAWFQADTTTGAHHILWAGYAGGNGYGNGGSTTSATSEMSLSIGSYIPAYDNKIVFFLGYDVPANGADSIFIASASNFTDTTGWHHVGVTVTDVGGGVMSASLYVDGKLEGTDTGSQNDRSTWNSLRIGATGDGSRSFDGNLDEVRIFDIDLTGAEVQAITQSGVLQNDSDVDGDRIQVNTGVVTGPSNGALNLYADGSFTYTPNPHFAGTDTFTYLSNDGTTDSNVATVTITVNPVNDAPAITNLSGDTLAYSVGSAATTIEQGGDVSITDVDSADFDTGALTVSFAAGGVSGQDVLAIRNQGVGAAQIGVSGADVTYAGTTIGTWAGGSGGSNLVVTLNANADATNTAALVRNITYQNTNTTVPAMSTRTVRFVLNDGDGDTSLDHDTTINVTSSTLAVVTTESDNASANDGDTSSITALNANKGTDGLISLREAITAANNTSGADTIRFNIVGGGVKTIAVSTWLPSITGAVVIDGTTQPDYAGSPIIELNGAATTYNGVQAGLVVTGGSTTIKGLVINRFAVDGIRLQGGSGNVIQGNHIGTDATGQVDLGNGYDGIFIVSGSTNNTIGGPNAADRNVISGNNDEGIEINGGSSNLIQGNYIGLAADGASALGNTSDGVLVASGTQNQILQNRIATNAGLGINLAGGTQDGFNVTANDAGDGDAGPNNLQNFPVLTIARTDGASQLTIGGTLNSAANSHFRIEFFASTTQDSSVHGEGQRYLGFANVTTDGSGNATIAATLGATVAAGESISATATRSNAGFNVFTDTSEFSLNLMATVAPTVTTTGSTLPYLEDDMATMVDGGLTVSDADSSNITSATVTISANYANGQDVLAFTDQLGIAGNWNAVAGILTLTGTTTVANYQTALQSVTYVNSSDNPSTATRTVSFVVSDGAANSAAATRDVSVAALNDSPVGLPTITGIVTEDQTLSADTPAIADGDGLGAFSYQWLRDGADIAGATSATHTLGDADVGTQVSVRVSYTDGNGTAETLTSALTAAVANVNDAPTTTPVTLTAINEDGGPRLITQAELLANAVDVDGPALTATNLVISSGNGTLIDNGNGTWSFTPAANDDTSVSFGFTVTDGTVPVTGTASLDITPVNDPPSLTSAMLSVAQNATVTIGGASFPVTDADGPAATFTVQNVTDGYFERVSAPGTPITTFSDVELAAGQIRFVHIGGTAMPGFEVSASDGAGTTPFIAATVSLATVQATDPTPAIVGDFSPRPIVPALSAEPVRDNNAVAAPTQVKGIETINLRVQDPVSTQSGLRQAPSRPVAEAADASTPAQPGPPADSAQVRIAATGFTLPAVTLPPTTVPEAPRGIESDLPLATRAQLIAELAGLLDEEPEPTRFELALKSVQLASLTLSVGVVTWILRAGGLISSLLASLPAWRHMDPLPILARDDEEENEEPLRRDPDEEQNERRVDHVLSKV